MNRRRYLATLTTATGLLAGCVVGPRRPDRTGASDVSGEPTDRPDDRQGGTATETANGSPGAAATDTDTPREWTLAGEPFERVVDAVEDAGCDPSGEVPCDDAFDEVLSGGTLLRFPGGTYRFERPHRVVSDGRVGVVGDGDVRFAFPPGFNDFAFVFDADGGLFEGVDLDLRAEEAVAGVKLRTESAFRLADVEQVGRGISSAGRVPHLAVVEVTDPDGTGIIRNLVAPHGSAIGHYKAGDGRGGVYVGLRSRGTVRIVDCHLAEFGNNGLYCSRTRSDVQVEGGVFRNNNAANVRISGAGSYVDGATVEVDLDAYTGPRDSLDTAFNPRGIVVEQGQLSNNPKPPGAEVRNCDVAYRSGPNNTQGAIQVQHTGRSLTVRNTRIVVDVDLMPAVRTDALVPDGPHPPAEPPRGVTMENVVIGGRSSTGEAVRLVDAVGSRLRNCTIRQPGADRPALRLVRSSDCVIEGGSFAAAGPPVVVAPAVDPRRDCLVSFQDDVDVTWTGFQPDPGDVLTFDLEGPERCVPAGAFPDDGGRPERVALFEVRSTETRGVVLDGA